MADFILQTAPTPIPGATVYQTVDDVLARIDQWRSKTGVFITSFPALAELEDQQQIMIDGTRQVEIETSPFLTGCSKTPGGSFLLWPRVNAFASDGATVIDGLPLESWNDALLLFWEELSFAKLSGDRTREPGLLEGVFEEEVDSEGAEIRRRYVAEGARHDFFAKRPEMFRLLSQSFRGCG